MEFPRDLVLDVGNSSTKAALFQGRRALWLARVPHAEAGGVERLARKCRPERIAAGSVAAEGVLDISALRALAPLHMITVKGHLPIRLAYATPQSLGVDRLANAVAAWQAFPGRAVLAIDGGTCITYDLVDAAGTYLGGAISPGMAMRGRAMNAFSAHLPLVEVPEVPAVVGDSTAASLSSGMHHGIRLEMEGMIRELGEYHAGVAVVLTGGNAPRFATALKFGIFADPLLTLRGLHALLLHQSGPPSAPGAPVQEPPAGAGA